MHTHVYIYVKENRSPLTGEILSSLKECTLVMGTQGYVITTFYLEGKVILLCCHLAKTKQCDCDTPVSWGP